DLFTRDYISGKRLDFMDYSPYGAKTYKQSALERYSLEEPQLTGGRLSSGQRVAYKQYQKDIGIVKGLERKVATTPKQVIKQDYKRALKDFKSNEKALENLLKEKNKVTNLVEKLKNRYFKQHTISKSNYTKLMNSYKKKLTKIETDRLSHESLSKWGKAQRDILIHKEPKVSYTPRFRDKSGISKAKYEHAQALKQFKHEIRANIIKKPDIGDIPKDFITHRTIDVDKGLARETQVVKLGRKKIGDTHITLKEFEPTSPRWKSRGGPGQKALTISREEPVFAVTKTKTKTVTKKTGKTRKVSKTKKKKLTDVEEEYLQGYESQQSSLSDYGEASLAEGPSSPFGKMATKKSGWAGTQLRDLDDIYSVGVHEHWKDVAPYIGKSVTPSIYQGVKGKLSTYTGVKKLPAYQTALGIGVGIRTIPGSISGSIPIHRSVIGELPKEENIPKNIRDNVYDVLPIYRQDDILDTVPDQRQ
ncbi:unnamed protein product, partial [marine sediment metagenome]